MEKAQLVAASNEDKLSIERLKHVNKDELIGFISLAKTLYTHFNSKLHEYSQIHILFPNFLSIKKGFTLWV